MKQSEELRSSYSPKSERGEPASFFLAIGKPLCFAFWILSFTYLLPAQNALSNTAKQPGRPAAEIVPIVSKAISAAVSQPVATIAPSVAERQSGRLVARYPELPNESVNAEWYRLPRERDGAPSTFSFKAVGSPTIRFDGLSNFDNLTAFGFFLLPPDTAGDVGPDHYVQTVNSLFRVFTKTGQPLTPVLKLSQLFAPLNTPCAARNDGDSVVLYDTMADRWLISQYCTNFPPFRQLFAVSETGDATGTYFLYEFVMPGVRLNDFPKLGVWHDGYYMSTEEFLGSDYTGSGVFAFDRRRMLRGEPAATYIYFSLPSNSSARRGGVLPLDLDGLLPPSTASNEIFAGYSATEYGDTQDAIRLFDFHPDFEVPGNSTFVERPESPIPVAAFDPTSNAGRADIGQPAPGAPLDSNSDRLMYRAAYRNHGSYESIVLNQTVRVSQPDQIYRAGVRVYQLRRDGGGFFVDHQGTIDDGSGSRWIGSVAEDHDGNIAVGYNYVTDTEPPSLVYSGRLASDPSGIFRAEQKLIEGTGVQRALGFRWGDYSSMTVDPTDDCTFWMSGEYYTRESQEFSDFTWLTKVGTFKFSECEPAPRARLSVMVIDAATGLAINNADVTVTRKGLVGLAPITRQTNEDGAAGPIILDPGNYRIDSRAAGYSAGLRDIAIGPEENLSLSIPMTSAPLILNSASEIVSGSCAIDSAAEPGETISMKLSFENAGLRMTQRLRIRLDDSAQVRSLSPVVDYGIVLPGAVVSRTFTFTISPNVKCGERVMLSFTINDRRLELGKIELSLPTGKLRVVGSESFDAAATPDLPTGWETAATGAAQPWVTTATHSFSIPNAAFSPAPGQTGINELVSPEFMVTSDAARIEFANRYELETTFLRNKLYDGSVLEIKIGSGKWEDILAAGGTFDSGGYDGPLDSCCQNPLSGRLAWSGRSGPNAVPEFIHTSARLPAFAAGNTVRFRWRVGTDFGVFREGQYIDDVLVTDGFDCTCKN